VRDIYFRCVLLNYFLSPAQRWAKILNEFIAKWLKENYALGEFKMLKGG
jgi:hypothetical protein